MRSALLLAVLAAAPAAAAAQEVSWVETRFHRIHLRNGNFIDGRLVRETRSLVVVEVRPAGEFGVRRDMIHKVEFIKMRSIVEAAPIVAELPPEENPKPPAVRPGPQPEKVDRGPAKIPVEVRRDVDAMLVAFASTNPEGRRSLGARLREKGPEAVAYACWLARHGKPAIEKADLIEAIGQCDTADVLPALLDLAGFAPDSFARGAAVKALARMDGAAAAAAVEAALTDRSGQVWRVAKEEILTLYKQGRVNMESLLARFKAAEYKEQIADVLSKIGGETALDALQQLLKEGDNKDKAFALRALATHQRVEDAEIAADLLDDKDVDVRREACYFLGKVKHGPSVRALLGLLDDDEEVVSESAHWALRQITGQTYARDIPLWNQWWDAAGKAKFGGSTAPAENP